MPLIGVICYFHEVIRNLELQVSGMCVTKVDNDWQAKKKLPISIYMNMV